MTALDRSVQNAKLQPMKTVEQLDLLGERRLDVREARRRKTEAIDAVERGADAWWFRRALQAVRSARVSTAGFTTDDVWAILGDDEPRENRAMGAVMREAHRSGLARPTVQYRPSADPRCHGRPKRVWVMSAVRPGGPTGG